MSLFHLAISSNYIFPLCFQHRALRHRKYTSRFDSIAHGFSPEPATPLGRGSLFSSGGAIATSFRRRGPALEVIANSFGRSLCSSTACMGMASTFSCLLPLFVFLVVVEVGR